MKKLPLLITVCLLVSVIAWAEWIKPDPKSSNIYSKVSPSIACSADGKIIYLTYNSFVSSQIGYGAIVIYKSIDGGDTWAEQIMSPGQNSAK